jgi:hypothetical protein
VGCIDRAPAGLGGLDELERHGQPGRARPGSQVTLLRCRTVANVLSMGFKPAATEPPTLPRSPCRCRAAALSARICANAGLVCRAAGGGHSVGP